MKDFLHLYTSGCPYFSSDPGPFIVSTCSVTHYCFTLHRFDKNVQICQSCDMDLSKVQIFALFFGIYLEISSIIKYLKLKKLIWKRAFASRRLLHFGIVLPSHKDRQELVFKPEKSQQTENSFWQGISRAGDLGWGMMGRKPGARQLDWKPHHPLPPLSSVSPSSPALI